ncbi:MAG: DUF4431 domain-containing protein [Bacteroidales bacterium]|nr:DUF4431 domain-containing protein [Bacteroidales bacterium]
MKKNLFYTIILSLAFATSCKNNPKSEITTKIEIANQQDYYYEPTESVISGTIKSETFFGPPGYGDNPQTDSREDYYILYLDNSINVISESKEIEEGDFNYTRYNIYKIQIAPAFGSDITFTKYENKFIQLTGTFYGAHSGHHKTDVILSVNKIEEIK